ncbi:hypothetical protein U9M48_035748 [Paspalum notatum var. saurae]|uniref:Uncharacterized protein n=1 Tax=Paspalum notatum var. saurae TaxID=547442 RepID=A0AAQ3UG19_PASNO
MGAVDWVYGARAESARAGPIRTPRAGTRQVLEMLEHHIGVDPTVSSLSVKKSSSLRVLSSSLKTSLSKATPEDFGEYVQDFNEF